jgi:2,4-dienoyl-CoA reductase-like NADH-dependent reductase (Old Yellow Enzyme family)/thioredoxin reductase
MAKKMFETLFSPLEIGPITIKNRIQITPHELQYMNDGLSTETVVFYYAERAKGGVGLMEVSQLMIKPPFGLVMPDWEHDSARRFPLVCKPELIPGLEKLSQTVHEYGSKIFMEVSAWPWLYGSVSSIPFETGSQLKELTITDLREIQGAFRVAAEYVKKGGFDGVDLHGTHGTLIEHFYSPASNRRTDQYGGTLENRMKFVFEVIDIVHEVIGDSMAIGMRLCADEKLDCGVTPQYAAKMAELFDGKIDFVNVDSGSSDHYVILNQAAHQTQPLYVVPGYGVYMSAAVKKVVKETKVGAVGIILDPLLAEHIIRKGTAYYVGMTRALIADPELPKKALEGRLLDIRPCIGTLQDCWGRSVSHEWPMRCTVNPTVGREKERGAGAFKPAKVTKKVLIIGSGPAGLEAACVASERGHDVVIYEKNGTIGGQLNLAKLLPGRSDIGGIVGWYERQLKKNRVRIEFHKEVLLDLDVVKFLIDEEKPDSVLIATGSSPIRTGLQMITYREVLGWDRPNVHTIDDVLQESKGFGGKVLVADSTTYIEGPGIAEWLSRRGASVTLVTPHPHVSPQLSDYNQLIYVVRRLHDAHVNVLTYSWITRIQEGQVTIRDAAQNAERDVPADHVVLNTGRQQNGGLEHKFRSFRKDVCEIGDCKIAGGMVRGAIEDGYRIGCIL